MLFNLAWELGVNEGTARYSHNYYMYQIIQQAMAFGFANMNIFSYTKTLPSAFTMYFTRIDIPQQPQGSILQLPAYGEHRHLAPWGAALYLEGMGLGQLNTEVKPIPTKQQYEF